MLAGPATFFEFECSDENRDVRARQRPKAREGVFSHLCQLPHEHFQTVAQAAVDAEGRGRFIARVHEAMFAAWVVAMSVFGPVGVVDETVEGFMMLVGDKVTGAFPTF